MSTESSRLLSPRPSPARRPPLLSMPSSQSLRSSKNTDGLLTRYCLDDVKSVDFESLQMRCTGSGSCSNDCTGDSGARTAFSRWAYVSYYLPILRWLPNYKMACLLGDFLAGATMASFQIPLVMSLATSLAKLPPLIGLYSVLAAAIMYAIFGGVSILVVGPLPSTAVLYGQVIEKLIHSHDTGEASFGPLEISSTISIGMSVFLLACGLLKGGFLDNVLSRALLKGFIGAMGVIMIVNQIDIQTGLHLLALKHPHSTILGKLWFALSHLHEAHRLTTTISVVTLAIVLAVRELKMKLVDKYKVKSAVYIPELLAMVIVATGLSYWLDWESQGVEIVGSLNASVLVERAMASTSILRFELFKRVFQTSVLCSVLGFFDSTTATKALGAKYNYNISSNRELVALGMCNIVIALFGGLPSFGALGRSKVNILAGALTPVATIIMAVLVLVAIRYFLGLLYYLPECVLALSTTIIGISVLEEVPHDLAFFWAIGGYGEICWLLFVFATTIMWSVEAGVILGIVVAVVRIIKAGSKSHIHILGRVPNTSVFRNADELIEESFHSYAETGNGSNSSTTHNDSSDHLAELVAQIQQIEGMLIIKIPEPLDFANSGDLRGRLNRLERFGTLSMHPSQPAVSGIEKGSIRCAIFDCKGMTSIDAAATQTLLEIVLRYVEVNGICVAFTRVPTDNRLRRKLCNLGIVGTVNRSFNEWHKDRPGAMRAHLSSPRPSLAIPLGAGFFWSIDEAVRALCLECD